MQWFLSGTNEEQTGIFRAGSEYFCYVTLLAKDGYIFDTEAFKIGDNDENTDATINGYDAYVASVTEESLVMYKNFETEAIAEADPKFNDITLSQSTYTPGATMSFTLTGSTRTSDGETVTAEDGNVIYFPVGYKIDSGTMEGIEDGEVSVEVTDAKAPTTTGEHKVNAYYERRVYDAAEEEWVLAESEEEDEEASRSFTVSTSSSSGTGSNGTGTGSNGTGTGSTGSGSGSNGSGGSSGGNGSSGSNGSNGSNGSSDDGNSANSTSTDPKTGDQTPIMPMTVTLLVAIAAVGAIVYGKRRLNRR